MERAIETFGSGVALQSFAICLSPLNDGVDGSGSSHNHRARFP